MVSKDKTTRSVTKLDNAMAIAGAIFVAICIIVGAFVLGSMPANTQDKSTSSHETSADLGGPAPPAPESINVDDINPAELPNRVEDFVNKTKLDFWNSIKPSIECPPSLMMTSLGDEGDNSDGMVCGLNIFQNMEGQGNLRDCLFYTFGSDRYEKKLFTFESELLVNTNCDIFAFLSTCWLNRNPLMQPWNNRITFMEAKETKNEKELESLMEKNGHDKVDVVKVDVDVVTVEVLEANIELLKHVGQFILRFRWNEGLSLEDADKFIRIIRIAQNSGFRLFHAKSECYAENQCKSDFSFLNVNAWGQFFLKSSKVGEKPK